ncbi:hypothetical protein R8510_05235 [Ralstonia chuxiongensis]|nr:hypothetical protein R8510_05235 [Ralstonia chuxiongensis]
MICPNHTGGKSSELRESDGYRNQPVHHWENRNVSVKPTSIPRQPAEQNRESFGRRPKQQHAEEQMNALKGAVLSAPFPSASSAHREATTDSAGSDYGGG